MQLVKRLGHKMAINSDLVPGILNRAVSYVLTFQGKTLHSLN